MLYAATEAVFSYLLSVVCCNIFCYNILGFTDECLLLFCQVNFVSGSAKPRIAYICVD